MTDKPWTAPGLSSRGRAIALLGRHVTDRVLIEALDAHARDAVQQERERLFKRLSKCNADVMFFNENAYAIYADHLGVLSDEDAAETPNGWEVEPTREDTP